MSAVTEDPPGLQEHSGRVGTWTSRIIWLNLLAQTAIVVTGGLVRLSGSGLGCPTWPECVAGSVAPVPYQEEAWHKYVEFGNRLLTFLLVAIAIAVLVAVIRHRPRRRALIVLGAVPLVGTLAQALLGGVTVLTGLNPWTVSAHFLVSMALIAGAVVLWVRAREPGDQPVLTRVSAPIRPLSWALVVVAGAILAVGTVVTGSGPHSGDTDVTHRYTFEVRAVAWLHADLVVLFIGLLIGVLVALTATAAPADIRRVALWLLGLSVAQGALGYAQFFAGVPWFPVLVHQLGACLVWMTTLLLLLATRSRGIAGSSGSSGSLASSS